MSDSKVFSVESVVKEGEGRYNVLFSNDHGNSLSLLFDGHSTWKWGGTEHIVRDSEKRVFERAYRRWERKGDSDV